jgi:hypothetical protein
MPRIEVPINQMKNWTNWVFVQNSHHLLESVLRKSNLLYFPRSMCVVKSFPFHVRRVVYSTNTAVSSTTRTGPSLHTQVHEACAHSWSKMVSRMTERRFHMLWRYMNVRARTRKPAKSPYKGSFFGLSAEQLDLQFQGRRCTWRSWSYLKLQCLCCRLRIGVVKTHSDVNSWPSRSPSS